MFSHVTVGTNDIAKAKAFYDGVTAPLGLVRQADYPDGIGYGRAGARLVERTYSNIAITRRERYTLLAIASLFDVLRDKAITLGIVSIVKTIGYRLEFFDEIEAETGIERSDVLLAPTIGNASDGRDLGIYFGYFTVPKHDRVGGM